MERSSLQGLCFDEIEKSQQQPEDLGLCEEISLQYYKDLAGKLQAELTRCKSKFERCSSQLDSAERERTAIIEMIHTAIGDRESVHDDRRLGDHLHQLISSGYGALKCTRCNSFTMVDDDAVFDTMIRFQQRLASSCRYDIREVPFMIDSLCKDCWHAKNQDKHHQADLLSVCKMCFQKPHEAFSLLNETAAEAMDLDNWFFLNEAKAYSGKTSFIGCLCRGCYETSQ